MTTDTDTDKPRTAVTEDRTFTVRCRRRIVDGCHIWDEVSSDSHGVRSITAAEAAFRDDGWQLHTDGTASCPRCLAAWEDGYGLPEPDAKGDPEAIPEPSDSDIIVDPPEGNIR